MKYIKLIRHFRAFSILAVIIVAITYSINSIGVGANGGSAPNGSTSSPNSTGSSQGSQNSASSTSPTTQGEPSSSSSLGGTILTYRVLRDEGTAMANQLSKLELEEPITNLFVTSTPPNQADSQALYFYFRVVYSMLISNYTSNPPFKPSRGNAGFIPSETLGDIATATAQFLSLMRTTTTLTEGSGNLDPNAFIPHLCAELGDKKITSQYIDMAIDGEFINDTNSLAYMIIQASMMRMEADSYIATVSSPTENDTQKKNIAFLTTCNKIYDNLYTNMIGPSLGGLLNDDYIYVKLSTPGNYLLFVTNSYALSETRVQSNPITDIITDGPRISFMGGSGLAFYLYHGTDMSLTFANRIDAYSRYQKFPSSTSREIKNDLPEH